MSNGIPCMWMRGGTSKGGYFLASDLPADRTERDQLLLSIMGSPDPRQIDGMGGGDPLTSKVAIVAPSKRPGIDVTTYSCKFLSRKAASVMHRTAETCWRAWPHLPLSGHWSPRKSAKHPCAFSCKTPAKLQSRGLKRRTNASPTLGMPALMAFPAHPRP